MFEWLFAHPLEVFRTGELVWQSPWPAFAFWGLWVGVGSALVATALRRRDPVRDRTRRAALVVLQIAALGIVLAVLWEPAWRVRRIEPGRNRLLALIDHSRSMSFGDERGTRLDLALEGLRAGAWPRIEERFEVESYAFGRALRRVDALTATPEFDEQTALAASLRETLQRARDGGAAAVVLVSDGRENRSPYTARRPDWLAELSSYGVPVHVIAAGRRTLPEDLELVDARLPARAIRGSRIGAQVTLRHGRAMSTAEQAERARLVIREGGRPRASQEIVLNPETPLQTVDVELDVTDAGLLDLEIALDPLPGERILANNVLRRLVEVPREPRRVLYLEGEPRWEYKFLRRALRDDAGIALVSLLRTTQNKLLRQGVRDAEQLADGFPTRAEELFAYDAVVIGSFEASALSRDAHQLLERFVRQRGGGLLMLAGARGLGAGGWGETLLAPALPARLSRSAVVEREAVLRPTRHGAITPWLRLASGGESNRERWLSLPGVTELQPLGDLKLGATSLLERVPERGRSRGESVLAVQRYGRGSTAVFGAAGTWRWHMQSPTDDPRHARFWRQLLRSLTTRADAPLHAWIEGGSEPGTDGDGADDSPARIRADLRSLEYEPLADARVVATLTRERGSATTLELSPSAEPGLFSAPVDLAGDALYRIDLRVIPTADGARERQLTLHHRAADRANEASSPAQNREALERIASATGGRVWDVDGLAELPEALAASPRSVVRFETYDLSFMPVTLILLLGLRVIEWSLRKHWGWI